MTRKEADSCIHTIELLRRLAFNIHGVMDVVDADNCDKMIDMLKNDILELNKPYPVGDYIVVTSEDAESFEVRKR